jgi:hypothetical protein
LEVADRVAELLRHAQAAGGAEKCVLFQHLQVEEVPVCEVVYEYRGPPERRLWIYGRQRFVFGAATVGQDRSEMHRAASCCCGTGVGGVGNDGEMSIECRLNLIKAERLTMCYSSPATRTRSIELQR